jgi:starvation-inducible DNA-binding protein
MSIVDARKRREAPLDTPSNLGSNETKDISAALTALLADVFALYVKTKNPMAHIRSAFPGLSPPSRRAGRADLRDDGRNRGKNPQDWRHTIGSIGHIARVNHIEDMMRISSHPKTCWPS